MRERERDCHAQQVLGPERGAGLPAVRRSPHPHWAFPSVRRRSRHHRRDDLFRSDGRLWWGLGQTQGVDLARVGGERHCGARQSTSRYRGVLAQARPWEVEGPSAFSANQPRVGCPSRKEEGHPTRGWLAQLATRGRTSPGAARHYSLLVRVMGEKLEEEKERGKGGGGRYMARRAGAEGDEGALSQRSVRERP